MSYLTLLKPAGFAPAASRSFITTTFRTRSLLQPLQLTNHIRPSQLTQRSNQGWKRAYQQSARREAYRRQAFNYQTFKNAQSVYRRWRGHPYFYYHVGGIAFVCGGFYVANLEHVPVSNRYRFNIISPEREASVGRSMYDETMQQYASQILPSHAPEHRMVQRVLDRLIPASGLQDEEWEVHVIRDPQKNAFVIPGGKVFVFSGILDIAKGDDGLAAVLGHEIAHNVAHHAAERMSQSFIFLPLAMVAFAFAGLDPSIGNFAVNLAFTLPGSRKQEAEADYIGLLMMAESCYDPSAAMGLWARMEEEEKGAPPQFLSTHPSNHNRLDKIRGWLPQAEAKRESSECGSLAGFVNDFRSTVDIQRW